MSQPNRPARIVLVDPNPAEGALVAGRLEAAGLQTRWVPGGTALLSALAAEPADLVILAAEPELSARLRTIGGRTSIAVLVLVDAPALEAGETASASCVGDDFLVRPVRAGELLLRVQALLRLRQVRDDLRDCVHNLKNPLSAILVNCQYLVRHATMNEEVREVIGEIAASAGTLSRKLRDGTAPSMAVKKEEAAA